MENMATGKLPDSDDEKDLRVVPERLCFTRMEWRIEKKITTKTESII